MKTIALTIVASATFILTGCGRPLDPTRPTPVPGLARPAEAGSAAAPDPAPVVEWSCVASATSAQRPSGCPARTNAAAVGSAATAPTAPVSLAGTTSDGRASLTWQAPAAGDPPTSYVLEAGSAPGRADVANFDTGTTTLAFTADNVPRATYYVRVRAKNAAGLGDPSNELVLIVPGSGCPGLPNAPTNLRASVSGFTVTLTWGAPAAGCVPASYVVQAGSVAGSSDLANFDSQSLATSFTAAGVKVGQYFVRVRGMTASGSGAASNEVSVTVVPLLSATSFVAFGDSITAGESGLEGPMATGHPIAPSRFHATVLLPLDQRYPEILQQDLVAGYRTQMPSVTNAGQGGEAITDPGTMTRFATVTAGGRFGVVLIMEGTNDLAGHDATIIPSASAGLRQMVRDAKRRGVRPYLATIPPIDSRGFRGRQYSADLVPALNDSIRALALLEGVPLVDVDQGFNNNFGLLGIDGLHPNAAGHAKIADLFYTVIKATLEIASPAAVVQPSHFIGRFR